LFETSICFRGQWNLETLFEPSSHFRYFPKLFLQILCTTSSIYFFTDQCLIRPGQRKNEHELWESRTSGFLPIHTTHLPSVIKTQRRYRNHYGKDPFSDNAIRRGFKQFFYFNCPLKRTCIYKKKMYLI
jgi:hypothetical protein